jgi:hypothetical protein
VTWVTDPTAADTTDVDDAACEWPVEHCCDPSTALDDATVEWTTQMAVMILWAATGRQFGICTETLRPCPPTCEPPSAYVPYAFDPMSRSAALTWSLAAMHCGTCGRDRCACSRVEQFKLPRRPWRSIVEVVIDGVTLDPGSYRLDGRNVIRTDGSAWPDCQDWNVDPGEVGSWEVTLRVGRPVPAGGPNITGQLACELAKACSGDDDCALPQRVQTVTRQGVTVGFLDPMQFLDEGKTGVYDIDLWIASVNPNRLIRPARVHRFGQRKLARRVRRPGSGS